MPWSCCVFTEPIKRQVLFIIAVIFISRAPWRRRSMIVRWPSSLCPIEWWISNRLRGTSPFLNWLNSTHLSQTCWTTQSPRGAKEPPLFCQRWRHRLQFLRPLLWCQKDIIRSCLTLRLTQSICSIEWLSVSVSQDKVLAQLLQTCKDHIVSFHEHESLLGHKQEEELSEAERKAAWAEYEAEVKSCTLQSINH